MNKKNESIYTAIRIEGGLLSTSLLDALRHYGLPGQGPADYGVEKGLKLADELGRYWRIAQARWEQFTDLRARSDVDRSEITIDAWLLPLFTRVLGFDIDKSSRPASIGERVFPITHMAYDGVVPLVLTSDNQSLDKGDHHFGHEGRKRSPMGLAQEYLNAEDKCLWAMASNGLTLRLLRDNPAMTRPAYVEVDFERIFNEELFVDFTIFWLLLHATRFEPQDQTPESCYLEQWREQGQTDGERVLGQLRYGVADALRLLGTGFVSHPDNKALREAIQSGPLTTDQFFQELLRLIYRILFLLTTEDREILLDPEATPAMKNLYREGYSISNLRDRARLRRYWDGYEDAWNQLLITFQGFARGQPRLGQPALGGLFASDQCHTLEQSQLANRYLFNALFKLCYFEANRVLVRINYRDMDTEELGSVYESLLELIPQLNVQGQWRFGFIGDEEGEGSDSGHARKLTGSYYTPDALVQELIQSALEPVVRKRLEESPANPREALLAIRVCDPACGSGHFLLAAARRMAAELARIEAGADQPSEADYHHALREVVRHCIYGVDVNPLAVELCRTALWLEAIEPGKPLGFLDAHVRVGNSLVGLLGPDALEGGIPDNAYKQLTGDDRQTCTSLKQRNRVPRNQLQLIQEHETDLAVCAGTIAFMPEENLEQIEEKREAWRSLQVELSCQSETRRADLFTAAFFAHKSSTEAEKIPTNVELAALERGEPIPDGIIHLVERLAREQRFFHWHLAFPEVFEMGGFDVVLANPPWEVSQLSEEEYFASRAPSIAALKGAKRKAAIKLMVDENPEVWRQYQVDKRSIEGLNLFFREAGRNPLTARGKLNLYALFAEFFAQAINKHGRAGVIVQSSIAIDNSTKDYFRHIIDEGVLESFYEFENRGFFDAGHGHMVRFALVTLHGSQTGNKHADFFFQGKELNELKMAERHFSLTAEEIALINPNTRTCPIFQSKQDAELTKKLYHASSVLIREADEEEPEHNPWGISFSQGLFNMTSASHLFLTHKDLEEKSAQPESNCSNWQLSNETYVPLYEAKMVYIYNHRHGDFRGLASGERPHRLPDIPIKILNNPNYQSWPCYWVPKSEVDAKLETKGWHRNWLLGWRDVTDARASVRTVVASVIPRVGVGDTFLLMFPIVDDQRLVACLLADQASLVHDYIARQKVGGLHLKYNIKKQLTNLPPSRYLESDLEFIVPRVLELTYTAWDLKSWAEDLGYQGDPYPFNPDNRHQLKCELDAYYARLYGLNRDELCYILDPADVMGEDYPSETFRVLKNKEINELGEYRTRRLVLDAWDRLENGELVAQPSTTRVITKQEAVVGLSTLPANAWARPMQDPRAEMGAQLAAIIKVMTEALPPRQVRLAALLAFEPRLLLPYLSEEQAAAWQRLVGDEATPLAQGASAFIARTDRAWGAAVRNLRTNGHLIEDARAGTWAPGIGLDSFVTEGWPDGRARMVIDVLQAHATDAILKALPVDLRDWVDASAA
ncbi:MAG: N-6 DNA methylase [Candidatus Thiodiazotropha taylori]